MLLTIGEAAAQVRRSPITLRRLEREGVVPPAPRDRAGRRFYTPEAVERIRLVIFPDGLPGGSAT
jgi:DNA-binding transcriptional MerR regulator